MLAMYLLQFYLRCETPWQAEGQPCTGSLYPTPHPLNMNRKNIHDSVMKL